MLTLSTKSTTEEKEEILSKIENIFFNKVIDKKLFYNKSKINLSFLFKVLKLVQKIILFLCLYVLLCKHEILSLKSVRYPTALPTVQYYLKIHVFRDSLHILVLQVHWEHLRIEDPNHTMHGLGVV